MFPLKLVRSLVSGSRVSTNPFSFHIHRDDLDEDDQTPIGITGSRTRVPLIIFTPTLEFVRDTYRPASISRDLGMDLQPNPSLSHIVFSWPNSTSSSSSSLFLCESSASSSSQLPTFSSSTSSLCTWSLPSDAVPLPFPSFATASLSHLRLFVNLSRGYFKLAFLRKNRSPVEKNETLRNNNWYCSSLSLFATHTGERIESMDGFSKAMLGRGWTLFTTYSGCKRMSNRDVYLYRKVGVSKMSREASTRVRELKFPPLVFKDMPLRILQYILLMTDDIFYLA